MLLPLEETSAAFTATGMVVRYIPDPTTKVLPQCFHRTLGKIGSAVYKREQDTVDCQVPIDVLLHLGNRR